MLAFDPYKIAEEMNDQEALNSWARYERDLLTAPVIAFPPSPYLQYEYPEARDEYGPLPEIWEESIRQVVAIYEESFANVFAQFSEDATIERSSYFPPAAYGKGGPLTFPTDLIQIIYEQKWLLEIGLLAFNTLVAEATKESVRRLRQWWADHGVPEADQLMSSHNPFVVRAVAEDHARRWFPKLLPGIATIHEGYPFDADYSLNGALLLVIVPCRTGSIIYLVNDKLDIHTIIQTSPKGAKELDQSTWLS